MIISKTKRVFLLALLLLVSFCLSVVKLISGTSKVSKAQDQCWLGAQGQTSCAEGAYPDACIGASSGPSAGEGGSSTGGDDCASCDGGGGIDC